MNKAKCLNKQTNKHQIKCETIRWQHSLKLSHPYDEDHTKKKSLPTFTTLKLHQYISYNTGVICLKTRKLPSLAIHSTKSTYRFPKRALKFIHLTIIAILLVIKSVSLKILTRVFDSKISWPTFHHVVIILGTPYRDSKHLCPPFPQRLLVVIDDVEGRQQSRSRSSWKKYETCSRKGER